MKKHIIFLLFIFVLNNNICFCAIKNEEINTIIFDLGGVAIKQVGNNAIAWLIYHIGPKKIFNYWRVNGKVSGTEIFKKVFEFCGYVSGIDNCEKKWYAGLITGAEIERMINKNIDKEENQKFFKNNAEKEVVRACKDLFTPENVAYMVSLNSDANMVIKRLKQKGYKLFILSDWESDSFKLVKKKYSNFFKLFDEDKIIISGDTKKKIGVATTKPDQRVFKYVVKLSNEKPQNCLFIDDKSKNTDAARKVGMKTITHQDWYKTRDELEKLKILC